jgi:beta-phosphoglucomutase-like phosphatase (HAD superfamily)
MNKITAVIDLFRKGSEVANVSAWKSGQISANALALFMLAANAAANAYGHGIALDDATALCIATGVLAVVNVVATNVSSARAGILPAKATDFPRVDGISAPAPVTGSKPEPDDHRLAAEALQRLRASASHTDPFHDSGT